MRTRGRQRRRRTSASREEQNGKHDAKPGDHVSNWPEELLVGCR